MTTAMNDRAAGFDVDEFGVGVLDLVAELKGDREAQGYAGVLLVHALDMHLEGEAEMRRHRFVRSILGWVFERSVYPDLE